MKIIIIFIINVSYTELHFTFNTIISINYFLKKNVPFVNKKHHREK